MDDGNQKNANRFQPAVITAETLVLEPQDARLTTLKQWQEKNCLPMSN